MSSISSEQDWETSVQAVASQWPPGQWCDLGVLIGCSGGADSVALVRALAALRERYSAPRGTLILAHFHHGLRGAEADADQEFVGRLAGQLGIRWLTARGTGGSRDEASLRRERLRFLTDVAHDSGARFVALGHTLDDNVETMLHHLMRGSGPSGLAAMPPARSLGEDLVLIRPLLSLRRDTLRTGLRGIGQPWREDSSNLSSDYRRNWIRAELVPLMESAYPQAVAAIGRAIAGQQQWRAVIDRAARDWLQQHQQSASPVSLRIDRQGERAVIIAALQAIWDQQRWPRQPMTYQHWAALADLVTQTRRQPITLPGNLSARVGGGLVVLSR